MSNLNSIDRVRHTQAVHIYVHMFILNPSLFIPKNSFQAQNPKTPNPIPPQINNQKLQKNESIWDKLSDSLHINEIERDISLFILTSLQGYKCTINQEQ